ncbi:glycosyltransferase [Roseomonas sp. OT10]|uniref:glycosyltransferase n=1 Tax=Roseomonas cutis TaxID=2897332 RepID=UPI001E2D1C34|nr:glycosyltransferase [Roseomonas sp. OT10]UFN50305.1 glycosyltransferase [Roseomonas sp. OT10]
MRVAVFVTNAPGNYGGGRLAATVLAQCLARAGASVCFVTNHLPVFHAALRRFGRPGRVETYLTPDFHQGLPPGRFDLVLLIPTSSRDRAVYVGARGFARRRGARLALFNFETPNWFNALSPVRRDEAGWAEWRLLAEEAAATGLLVLSNSRESERHARDWFGDPRILHDHWHQPINLDALARVAPQYRERRILAFVRPRDPHKGAADIPAVLCEALRGWTLSLIVGSPELDPAWRDTLVPVARRHGIEVEVHPLAGETRKFVELKRARLLLYPSRFEGYGLPPIEALAAGTPCVCYDLPVLREVCGDALVAVPPGDVAALREAVLRVAASPPEDWAHLPAAVESVGSVERCGRAALASLERFLAAPPPGALPPLPRPERAADARAGLRLLPPRLHPGAMLELRGRAVLPPGGRVQLWADGRPLGEARPGPDAPSGFALVRHHLPEGDSLLVEALALDGAGQALGRAATRCSVQAALVGGDEPPAGWQSGGVQGRREPEGAVVTGWAMANPPLLALEALAGPRVLWCQHGLSRPSTPAAPCAGFAIHAERDAAWLLEAAGAVTLVGYGRDGVAVRRVPLDLPPAPPGLPTPGPEPGGEDADAGEDPAALPLRAGIERAERDAYGVVELEGWVLSRPRVTAVRVLLGDRLLGETLPDRLQGGLHARHREYGDAYGGFVLQARDPAATGEVLRVEFRRGDALAHAVEVPLRPRGRNGDRWGTSLALLPDGLLSDAARPVTLATIGGVGPLEHLRGAADRAVLAELRRRAPLLLLLHGNPQGFLERLEDWRALADGVLLLNDLHPGADALAALLDRLRAEPGLGPVLRRPAEGGWHGPAGALPLGADGPGVLAALTLPDLPAPPGAGPWLAFDATEAGPGDLAGMLEEMAGGDARPLVVVDAPPLEPEAALRDRLRLPADVPLAWPAALLALPPGMLRGVLDLGPPGTGSPASLAAAARGVAVAVPHDQGPWPRGTVRALLAGAVPATALAPAPYAALDAILPPAPGPAA